MGCTSLVKWRSVLYNVNIVHGRIDLSLWRIRIGVYFLTPFPHRRRPIATAGRVRLLPDIARPIALTL